MDDKDYENDSKHYIDVTLVLCKVHDDSMKLDGHDSNDDELNRNLSLLSFIIYRNFHFQKLKQQFFDINNQNDSQKVQQKYK